MRRQRKGHAQVTFTPAVVYSPEGMRVSLNRETPVSRSTFLCFSVNKSETTVILHIRL